YKVSYDTDNFVDVKTITVTITGEGSYSGSVTRTYKITPASATVTADNKSKMFGEADPELTADVSGLYGTDKVEYTLSREPGENVGDYVITASGEADQGNYTVTYNPGTLTITRKGTLTVTGTPYEGIYDGNEHGSAASANVTEGTVISYKVGDGDWTATAPTIKDVGSREVTVKAE
ncbi:MBG domain-containing protein, partial [Jingyaoa shaoxingensis]